MKMLACLAFFGLVACGSATPTEPSSSQSQSVRWGNGGWGSSSSGGSGSSSGGVSAGAAVACPNEADPSASCASPDRCCFTNYTAAHDGYCSSLACGFGEIDCDGPEDCASGGVCCMNAIVDPIDGIVGYVAACTADACVTSALTHEMCHQDGPACSDPNASCVYASGADRDLPGMLTICD